MILATNSDQMSTATCHHVRRPATLPDTNPPAMHVSYRLLAPISRRPCTSTAYDHWVTWDITVYDPRWPTSRHRHVTAATSRTDWETVHNHLLASTTTTHSWN